MLLCRKCWVAGTKSCGYLIQQRVFELVIFANIQSTNNLGNQSWMVCESTPVQPTNNFVQLSPYLAEIKECWMSMKKSYVYLVQHQLFEPLSSNIE